MYEIIINFACLNRSMNKQDSCINRTLNVSPNIGNLVNLICIHLTIGYYEHNAWSQTVGKPRTGSVPPTMQSQIPKSRDVTLFFLDMTLLQASRHALFTSTPHVFLLNIFINKTERSIHFYWIHYLNKIVTWLTREYLYLWYRLLEINVGTRDTAADEML